MFNQTYPKTRPVGPQPGAHAGEPPDRPDGRAYLFIDHVAAVDLRVHLSADRYLTVPIFTRCNKELPLMSDNWRVCLHRDLCPDDAPDCSECFE